VYSTCSLSLEENEGVLSDIFEQFDGSIESEPIPIPIEVLRVPETGSEKRQYHPAIAHARRVLPDELFEGFFLCRIRKVRSTLDAAQQRRRT
jgi:16S rRNA C967 or C1407 C5-methylase (RsmB/RsmF family)